MRLFALAALLCCAVWAPPCSANSFSQLFRGTSHDFGTVARAAKTEYRFVFENPYNQPIHVRSIRTSCGCTTPIIETETVAPGGQGSILARFNTATHSGARAATVTVTFDRPSFGEVQLHVKGYIRTDVVFQPGEVNFGSLLQGESKTLEVLVDYAGKPSWQITGVRCDEDCIRVEREEKSRQNGRIQYAMTVQLSADAPAGPMEREIVLHTNDRNLTTIPLRVTANVLAEISVSPNMLSLGDVSDGDSIKQVIVLKAQQPFRVLAIESERFAIQSMALSEESKALHTLPLVLRPQADQEPGDSRGQIVILTDHPGKERMAIDVVYRWKTPALEPRASNNASGYIPFNPLRDILGATNTMRIGETYETEFVR